MAAITSGSATSHSQIELDWTALTSPNNGDSAITSYGIQWDQGTSTYVELIGESSDNLLTSYIVASGITAGTTYTFKIRAQNKWGWGDYSTTTSILAASVPSQIPAATTSINSATGSVKIVWTAPSTNGDNIDSYTINILENDGTTWTAETTDCDGSDSTIMSNLYCIVPMATL